MATKKLQTPNTENPTADQAFINSILTESASSPTQSTKAQSEIKEPATTDTESNETDTAGNNEKVLVNFKLNKTTLERLRTYCKENDMTLTAGIKRAIRKMLDE